MSHFSVLVATNNEEELEKKLLPFHEHESTGYDDYCEWVDDVHDKYLKEYLNDTCEQVFCGGRRLGFKWNEDVPEIKAMWKRESADPFATKEFIPTDGCSLRRVPFTEIYETFDKFMEDYAGYNQKNPATGKFERWTNPNSKWDWWEVGGRYEGKLITGYGTSLSAEISSNIDWQKMSKERKNTLEKYWEDWHFSYNSNNVMVTVDEIKKYNDWVERYPDVVKVIKDANEYSKITKAFQYAENDDWPYWSLTDLKNVLKSKEEYCIVPGLTYAFIDNNGHWNQRGEMGWWGIDDPDKATDNYNNRWWDFVLNLPEDSWVYIVDCHI